MMSHSHDGHVHGGHTHNEPAHGGHTHNGPAHDGHADQISSHKKVMLQEDLQDLLALLDMRFGTIPPNVLARIERIDKLDTMERLILVAANAADWQVFVQELQAGDGAFKLVGDHLSPI